MNVTVRLRFNSNNNVEAFIYNLENEIDVSGYAKNKVKRKDNGLIITNIRLLDDIICRNNLFVTYDKESVPCFYVVYKNKAKTSAGRITCGSLLDIAFDGESRLVRYTLTSGGYSVKAVYIREVFMPGVTEKELNSIEKWAIKQNRDDVLKRISFYYDVLRSDNEKLEKISRIVKAYEDEFIVNCNKLLNSQPSKYHFKMKGTYKECLISTNNTQIIRYIKILWLRGLHRGSIDVGDIEKQLDSIQIVKLLSDLQHYYPKSHANEFYAIRKL